MNDVLQQQVYSHYKMWYNKRHKNDITEYSKVTCNGCREKFDKQIMTVRKYGENQKTFYYCHECFGKLKNSR